MHTLTSFSPQILLMMELEAGLAEGPRTATTPLDMIWHTERKQRKDGREKRRREQETTSVSAKVKYILYIPREFQSFNTAPNLNGSQPLNLDVQEKRIKGQIHMCMFKMPNVMYMRV